MFIFLQPIFESVVTDLNVNLTVSIPLPGGGDPYEIELTSGEVETLLGAYYAAINIA